MADIFAAFDDIEKTNGEKKACKSDDEITEDDLMAILEEMGCDNSDNDEITDEDIEEVVNMLDETGDDDPEKDDDDQEARRRPRPKEKVGFWKSLLGFKK